VDRIGRQPQRQARAPYLKTVPLGRFAQRSDVAKCVLVLASDDAAYVTGHTIVIDGGQTLGIPGRLEDAAG
jgi:NAD(P)-dependent dehydrogenase (short-subunit alcohol dehydrogenase family)